MTAARKLVEELALRGVRVSTVDGLRLNVVADAGAMNDGRRQWLIDHKAELLAGLAEAANDAHVHRAVVRYRLPDGSVGVCLGREDDSKEIVVADLRERWPGAEVLT
ncbi:MAG: hypothetical protein QM741_18600 [Rudaea sp.]|uniref:TubC N-terminal docking domain-related protein n=1 Tax=Rudaea sp. TaxID=2136325 RepID=UPI0039E4A50C